MTLGLAMQIEPAFVEPGDLVTVTLTLSNPASIAVDNVSISSTLPLDIGYDTPLGPVIPGYNPLLRLLRWDITQLAPQEEMRLGFVGQINAAAQANALSLVAEAIADQSGGSSEAQASLIIIQPPSATPTPTPTPQPQATADPPGPPAQVQLGLKSESDRQTQVDLSQRSNEQNHRLAIYVMDGDGRAVADGTDVLLSVQGGTLSQNQLRTRDGVVVVNLRSTPGQAVSVTASAGQAQGSLQLSGSGLGRQSISQFERQEARYGEEAAAIVAARNAVRSTGPNNLRAENQSRQVDFNPGGLTFALKTQDERFKPIQGGNEHLELGFELTDLRIGQQSLLAGQPNLSANGNWVTLRHSTNADWHLAYEVGDASVEQYIVLEEEIDITGDLVIEGRFQTSTQPVLLSDEEGIRFVRSGQSVEDDELRLGYGPAWVEDARGRRLLAQMSLNGKQLQITVPEGWLSQADFPVVIDPVLGPSQLVSNLQGEASNPAVASDGTDFLTVWSWNGDIYGQRIDANGDQVGGLITINQATGVQETPVVVYNSVTGEYLVIWNDHRFGLTHGEIRGQRISTGGQLQGNELALVSPFTELETPKLAAASSNGQYLVVWVDKESGSRDLYAQLLTQTAAPSGSQLTISNATDAQKDPDVAYDSQADLFMVVWEDNRSQDEIYSQRIDATGALVGSNHLLVADSSGQSQQFPAVASNGNGQFLLVWEREFGGGTDRDIHGLRVTASTGLAEGSHFGIITDGKKQDDPDVVALSATHYLVVWQRNQDDGQIEARQVQSDGTLGSVLTLRDVANSGRSSYPKLAHGGSQSLAVWTDEIQAGQEIITSRRVADGSGGSTSGEIFPISPYYTRREYVTSAAGPNNDFLLAWQQANDTPEPDIFVQRIDSQGQASGSLIVITTDLTAQERPALARGANEYLLAWQDKRNEGTSGSDIYGHLLDNNGNPTGSLIAITTVSADQIEPAIAYDSSRDEYLVLWTDFRNGTKSDIYGQIVQSDGTLGAIVDISGLNNHQKLATMVYNPDQDQYLTVWQDHRGSGNPHLYGQLINPTGTLVGSAFGIVETTAKQRAPALAYNPLAAAGAGRYLVVWHDERNGNRDVFGHLIESNGTLSGSDFAIAIANDKQEETAVTALENDEFLVVWQDRRDSWPPDIYAQRIDGNGNLLDETDTPADESTTGVHLPIDDGDAHALDAVVSYHSALDMALVAWTDWDNGGIYAARYSVTTPPPSTADWQLISTANSPPVRGEHAMAYDPVAGEVVLYGGNAIGFPYETTTWAFDDVDWLSITSVGPKARYGAQMAYDNTEIILFGGSDETDTALGETWRYANDVWNEILIPAPNPRTYHSMVADPGSGVIYLFGGNDGTTYFNDLWKYENGAWTDITPTTSPSSRTLAGLAYDSANNRLLLFGGRTETGTLLDDLWQYQGGQWSLLDPGGGTGPPARMAHSLTYDPVSGNTVLAGGTTDDGDTLLGDTWHYNGGWSQATPTNPLPPRAYHQAVYTNGKIILFSDGEVWSYE